MFKFRLLIFLVFLICQTGPFSLKGQNLEEVFFDLPAELLFDINLAQRDSLWLQQIFTLPGGDSLETEVIEIHTDSNYLSISYYFTTGQSGGSNTQLAVFRKSDQSPVIVLARYAGNFWIRDQVFLYTFEYQNEKLQRSAELGLPESIPALEFARDSLSEEAKSLIEGLSSSYDIRLEDGKVIYQLITLREEDRSLLKTEEISYIWDGVRFRRQAF